MFRLIELLVLMEMVEGVTLEEHKPAGLRRMLLAFLAVAEGLEAMHRQGFLHCDIKPNNILVTRSGRVKLIDFGHACPVNTVKQRIQGTPDYISPEQVLRHPLTPRSDIFNLGATMYKLLTGSFVPSVMASPGAQGEALFLTDKKEQPIPVREINPNVPPALAKLVTKSCQRKKRRRLVSMTAVINALEAVYPNLARDS